MIYDDDTRAEASLQLLPHVKDASASAPSAETRRLVSDVRGRYPNLDAARIHRHLQLDGHEVPIEQIRGFLAGM